MAFKLPKNVVSKNNMKNVLYLVTLALAVGYVMNKQNIIEQRMTEHINLEIEILYRISHPHIIKLHNHFEDDDNIYLIMQYASKGQ